MPSPEERIAEFGSIWKYRRPGPITDPIWMEYALEEIDPALRTRLSAIRLETAANVYRAIAEGVANAAKSVASTRSGD
ncbi:MAG TPA: hypothetical protein VHD76_04835 [Bryobacteraceae bacterium]|jgi:hypothetical protein|nr:hypothetical protein [Bryobacteraceae bacterium]